MNFNIIIIIIILLFIYYNYKQIFKKIEDDTKFKIGIIEDKNINKITNDILDLYDENNLYIVKYDKNEDILNDLNSNNINLAVLVENDFIDACLGLNNYKENKLNNINFCTGLYNNFYYFLSNVFYSDKSQTNKIKSINDIVNFYELNKRHYIIGTESTTSLSFIGLYIVLNIYNLKLVDLKSKKEDIIYDDNVVFYYIDNIEFLTKKIIKNELDGIFLVRTFKDKHIKFIADNKEIIFLNMDFKNTIFDSLFSNYFIKKEIDTTYFNDDDIVNTSFETRSNRVILVSNNYDNEKIVEKLVKIYYENIDKLIFNLYNDNEDNNNIENILVKPLEMSYINKIININKGAHNYYKKIKYIKQNPEKQNFEKFKNYWKYDKIGLNKFVL